MNADPGDREHWSAARGTAFTMAERGSRWLEIDRKADRIIWGLTPGSAVDAEREDLHVQVEAADLAAKQ